MKIAVVPIGNSKGIRIPKVILERYHITQTVELETKGNAMIIRPFKEEPRKGWDEAFKKMCKNRDDRPLINGCLDLHIEDWEWQSVNTMSF